MERDGVVGFAGRRDGDYFIYPLTLSLSRWERRRMEHRRYIFVLLNTTPIHNGLV
jgi:hypothetical protein